MSLTLFKQCLLSAIIFKTFDRLRSLDDQSLIIFDRNCDRALNREIIVVGSINDLVVNVVSALLISCRQFIREFAVLFQTVHHLADLSAARIDQYLIFGRIIETFDSRWCCIHIAADISLGDLCFKFYRFTVIVIAVTKYLISDLIDTGSGPLRDLFFIRSIIDLINDLTLNTAALFKQIPGIAVISHVLTSADLQITQIDLRLIDSHLQLGFLAVAIGTFADDLVVNSISTRIAGSRDLC